MTATEIRNMTKTERLLAMEKLWEALCQDDQEIESPKWHTDILEERRRKIESGNAEFISIDDLKKSLHQ